MTQCFRQIYLDGQLIQIPVRMPTVGVSPRLMCTGDLQARLSSDGTDTVASITETYVAELYVAENVTTTGVGLFNGTVVAGNVTVAVLDINGLPLGQSASTAQAGTSAYQLIPLVLTLPAGTYFIAATFDTGTARFKSHVFGMFAAGKATGQTYGTIPKLTMPTTFTTGQGPIAGLY